MQNHGIKACPALACCRDDRLISADPCLIADCKGTGRVKAWATHKCGRYKDYTLAQVVLLVFAERNFY